MADQLDLRLAPIDPTVPGQISPDWRPPKTELWTRPKVFNSIPGVITPDPEMSIRLRQGIIAELKIDRSKPYMFQNVNENEDDIIEFSFHGDPYGTWNKLMPGNMVSTNRSMFFLNRTNKDVLYMPALHI